MIMDKENQVSNAQAVTAAAGSTDYIDNGVARDVGMGDPLFMMITVDESADASGSATVEFQLRVDDNTSFSSPKVVAKSDTYGKAVLTAGRKPIYIPIPPGTDERYLQVYYNVGTGPLTAGKFTAGIVNGVQKSDAYPDAAN